MDFSKYIDGIVSFAQNNPVIAIVIVLGILFFMYRKPKLFFGLLCLGFFLAGLLYVITNLAGSGSERKKALTQEEEQSNTKR
jgi:hypothetical protein